MGRREVVDNYAAAARRAQDWCERCGQALTLADSGAPRFLHPSGEAVCPLDNDDGEADSGSPSLTDRDPRFYCAPIETINAADLLGDIAYTLGAGQDTPTHAVVHYVCDEDDGIIAYTLGEDNAQRIVAALTSRED